MDQDDIDIAGLCCYFRRNASNAIQVRDQHGRWMTWTYPQNDEHAARRAAWMLRRLDPDLVWHAQRAALVTPMEDRIEAVLVTRIPGMSQNAYRLFDGYPLNIAVAIIDDTQTAVYQVLINS